MIDVEMDRLDHEVDWYEPSPKGSSKASDGTPSSYSGKLSMAHAASRGDVVASLDARELNEKGQIDITPGGDKSSDDKEEESNFRFSAKSLMLTYSQCEEGCGSLIMHIREICDEHDWKIDKYMMCDELHKNGGGHSHIGLHFVKRPNITKCDTFDFGEYHASWKPGKGKDAWQKIVWYIQKTGRWEGDVEFPKNPINYLRSKKDYEEWQLDAKMMNPERTYPIKIPYAWGESIKIEETKPHRKCIYLIVGPCASGKSEWAKGLRNSYFAAATKYPFEGYAGQDIIVFDDVVPEEYMLMRLADPNKVPVEIGDNRYVKKYLPPNRQRTILVICNPDTIPVCFDSERIKTRMGAWITWKRPHMDGVLQKMIDACNEI